MLQRKLELEPVAIFGVSTYESLALLSGAVPALPTLPTVTTLVKRLPRPARVLIVGAVAAWIADHFEVT